MHNICRAVLRKLLQCVKIKWGSELSGSERLERRMLESPVQTKEMQRRRKLLQRDFDKKKEQRKERTSRIHQKWEQRQIELCQNSQH
jgi:hypothetical protein